MDRPAGVGEEGDDRVGGADEHRGPSGDEDAELAPTGDVGVGGVRPDRPGDGGDGDARHGGDEPEREQGSHDGLDGGDPGKSCGVRPDVDAGDRHVLLCSRRASPVPASRGDGGAPSGTHAMCRSAAIPVAVKESS